MRRPHLNIRGKLILSISLPLLVTYLGLLAWDYHRQRNATMAQMQQSALERAEGTAAQLDARLSTVVQVTNSLATLLETPANRSDRQLRAALYGALRNPFVSSATITLNADDASSPTAFTARRGSGPPSPNRDRGIVETAPHEWHARAASSNASGWTDVYDLPPDDNGGTPARVCTYVVPIQSESGAAGSAALTIIPADLRRSRGGGFPRGTRGLGPPGDSLGGRQSGPPPAPPPDEPRRDLRPENDPELDVFTVFDQNGRLLIAADGEAGNRSHQTLFELARVLDQPDVVAALRDAFVEHESRVVRVAGLKRIIPSVADDAHHWIAMAPVASTGWCLISAIPESAHMGPVLRRLWQRAAFLAAGIVVLLLVVLAVSIGISRPIERLALAVDRVAAGDFAAEVRGIRTNDELGRLAAGFNNMTRQLQAQLAAAAAQTRAREKVESELRIARQIQTDLLPKTFPPFPERREFALHAINLPALAVAGDFYDFFFVPSGLLTIVVADVSGKGVPAALLMAVTRTIVRNLAQTGLGPAGIIEATNRTLLSDTSGGMFVTMLLCHYDPATGRMTYVNAGHPPPLRLRSGSEPTPMCALNSPLLGVDARGEMGAFEQAEDHLAPGDTMFVYTDGVPDSQGPGGGFLETAGVARLVRPLADAAPDAVCHSVTQHLDHLGGGGRNDDVTVLALSRTRLA